MEAPVFENYDPAGDCHCAGCVQWRRTDPSRARTKLGARHALVAAAAAGTVIGGVQLTPAAAAGHHEARPGDPVPGDATPQGGTSPLHGAPGQAAGSVDLAQQSALRTTTRAAIINRAKTWVSAKVPYNMDKYWSDGYRQDCSGFVSMAWDLPGNEWTGSLAQYGTRITKAQLQPGDILLFHNPSDPEKGSHVTIFGGWTDYTRSYYIAYEQTRPGTRKQATPYAYWTNSSRYLAYRYKGVKAGTTSGADAAATTKFPGAGAFGPGANNAYVTQLGRLLVERGGKRFYSQGPGPRWGDADRRATQAFQRAQGWSGADADGIPGPTTWSYLVGGKGKDIPGGGSSAGSKGSGTSKGQAPAFPGTAVFRPGSSSGAVTKLGKQLVKKGFGKYYAQGPGPRWGEADRRAVEAFQRAQGWRGAAADGYPGPETWRRLFS
ncbi:peptidoglycan-binding protein [Streptomyces sp. VRA16 Mangrove soil]|uniref:peptidoglycan-binding protein n=1 Tax=Streptomyces sp. VRA16 Mangrove soil TaxID=2817434 RepID=UPI001A9E98F7|nr:peptidoglycan-binding protein [Streptomyces sp. VRA16 Mangrove soil]MBO1334271.1 peptidoglycan-binding protein [Streptomyces sp. VRA16 Mangrove soil]